MYPNFKFSLKIPPRIEEVKIYFNQKGISEAEAAAFFLRYEKKKWQNKSGDYLKSWKSAAYRWILSTLKSQPLLFNRHIH